MMLTFRYGGKKGQRYALQASENTIVIRSETDQLPIETTLSAKGRRALENLTPLVDMPDVGVQVFAAAKSAAAKQARTVLKREPKVRFAGRALRDPRTKAPVVYTENAFVKFHADVAEGRRQALLKKYKLFVKREVAYAPAAYFVGAAEGTGMEIFALTSGLLDEKEVELCHPELVRKRALKGAFPQQWHLKQTTIGGKSINAHANVEAAWAVAKGAGITIAVIDDGFDLFHDEFKSAGKIVAPRDVTRKTNHPLPGQRDRHGQACAGVACAEGIKGASGVAPKARLMPIRLMSALGSQNEADAFHWAADNGADIISCSWGPEDGDPWDASDPLHKQVVPLPDSTRLAIRHALQNGRGGKGCVILFAAGNGNESVDNDGYAANPDVIAVAACNDQSKRSAYSDKGRALWCSFPSSAGVPSLTPGIWTTDLSGLPGYNDGNVKKGDVAGNFTNSFGGTSSATPGAAGVAALVLSKNPNLRADQVRDILKRCCDRIDKTGGAYDSKGHSKKYGFGRLNAKRAVDLA
jgi:subtilisin family serine protease